MDDHQDVDQNDAGMREAREQFVRSLFQLKQRKGQQAKEEAATAQLIELLHNDIRDYRRYSARKRNRLIIRGSLITGLVLLLSYHKHVPYGLWTLFGGGALIDSAASTRERNASRVAKLRDPRVVSVLAIAYRNGDLPTRQVVRSGLLNNLCLLHPQHAAIITKEAMEALIYIVTHNRDDLALAVMQALEQVGDSRAIPAVTSQRDRIGAHDHLVQAAQNCLAAIGERAELERQRLTLLRPSQSPANEAQILLRPAASASNVADEQLLRPADGPES